MYRITDSMVAMHDSWLVVLSILLCLFACATAMTMLARARDHSGRMSLIWAGAAGLVSGCGIWAMHFVAMLGFETGFPISYEIGRTVLSIFVAIVLSATGFIVALKPGVKRIPAPVLGGAIIGIAIAAMHRIGMVAMSMPAVVHRHVDVGLLAVSIGIGLTTLAFWIAFRGNSRGRYAVAAFVFTLAITGMHFTGTAAVTLEYDPAIVVTGGIVSPFSLAIAVTACALLILALGCAGAIFDYHLAERNRGEQQRLKTHVAELEVAKAHLEAAGKKLKIALATAASASQAKSEFLASMSHELRTPLNAIIGFSEMMKVEAFGRLGSARYMEYAGDIHDSGKHLLALINDILDLSRLDAGALTLYESDFNLHEVILQGMKMISRQAGAKDIRLVEDLPAQLPNIHADERRIKQVLINLLANAVKFTPEGGSITVRARVEEKGLSVAVIDTGIGIAPEDIAKALEPFSQIDASVSREHGGAGLGLPLSSQLIQLHGGVLTLESKERVGTTVTFTLPASRFVRSAALSAAE